MLITMLLATLTPLVQQPGPPSPVCHLAQKEARWEGSCGTLFEAAPILAVSEAPAVTTGVWQRGFQPTAVWAGEIRFPAGTGALEIEVYSGGSGVLRAPGGWVLVTGFSRRSDSLQFQLDVSQPVPPSDLDREIVRRAAEILSSESLWDRADDRQCGDEDKTWSIYCAMHRASVVVTGGFHHRRPALEVVRQIVSERSAGRNYAHRLEDYNNDPSARLNDVRSLFAEALTRMSHAP